jgi:hypothetical protein
MPPTADEWRLAELSDRDPNSCLTEACSQWQGNYIGVCDAMRALFRARESRGFSWDAAESVCCIMSNMRPLPTGVILWHAISLKEGMPNPSDVLPTSTRQDGARSFGEKHLKERGFKLLRLEVVDPAPLGIAIAGDGYFEEEKEVLVAPKYIMDAQEVSYTESGVDVEYYTLACHTPPTQEVE